MHLGISKTVPAKEGPQALEQLYDGSIKEYEFHMAGKPTRLKVGDYVYTIFEDMLHGRVKVKELITDQINPASGKPRTLVIVETPGERLKKPVPKKGHRGTRYFEPETWPIK